MIHLVIDSTALRNDPARKKAGFRAVKGLVKAEKLKLHIPYVVKQEFLTQQIEEYHAGLSQIATNISKFRKKNLPDNAKNFLHETNQSLINLDQQLAKFARSDFEEWLIELAAQMHPIDASHGVKVIDAYFKGHPPFREKKRRDDIPDAFIWQTVLDIAQQYGEVIVVSSDKGIKDASDSAEKVTAFSSIDEFISSDVCQPLLREEQAKLTFQRFLSLVPEINQKIEATIRAQVVDALHGKTVKSEQIPDDNNEGTIFGIGRAEDIEIQTTEVGYYGEGLFVVPVEFSIDCLISYAIFKMDFWTLSEEKAKYISISELNDHYYDAEEDYSLSVEASISLDFETVVFESNDSTDEELAKLGEDVDIALDSIDEVNVASDFDWNY